MTYKVLNLSTHPGKSKALFAIDKKGLRFSVLVARKMGLVRNAYVTPYVNSNNLLCFKISLTPDSVEALRLNKCSSGQYLYINCSKVSQLFETGSYQVVEYIDDLWVTDCKLKSTNA